MTHFARVRDANNSGVTTTSGRRRTLQACSIDADGSIGASSVLGCLVGDNWEWSGQWARHFHGPEIGT